MAEPNYKRKEQILLRMATDDNSVDGNPFEFFEENIFAWTHYFNKGINKLSALGATWGNNVVRPSLLSAVLPAPFAAAAAVAHVRLPRCWYHGGMSLSLASLLPAPTRISRAVARVCART